MGFPRFSQDQFLQLATLIRSAKGFRADASEDRKLIDVTKGRFPGLDRGATNPSNLPDLWIHLVILRGLQITMVARGYGVLLNADLLGPPFLLVHDLALSPVAVRSIPPHTDVLYASMVPAGECAAIDAAVSLGSSQTLSLVADVSQDAPVAGDVFAERVWGAARRLSLHN